MVIDHSLITRKIVKISLSRAGYDVVTFADCIQAYKRINETPPDLLLIGTEFEGMNGYEFAHLLRAHPEFANLPLLFLARRGGLVERFKARMAGGVGIVTKPLIVRELVAQVQKVLDERAEHPLADLPTTHLPSIPDNTENTQ
ncbi:response regulator [Thermosporothrix hazakensis]|jgi:DNA-binding response OmpR family regulator|nr:response regulator [Thermosporothrix hazakensis]